MWGARDEGMRKGEGGAGWAAYCPCPSPSFVSGCAATCLCPLTGVSKFFAFVVAASLPAPLVENALPALPAATPCTWV